MVMDVVNGERVDLGGLWGHIRFSSAADTMMEGETTR